LAESAAGQDKVDQDIKSTWQHHTNSLHLYCRLRDLGLGEKSALRLCWLIIRLRGERAMPYRADSFLKSKRIFTSLLALIVLVGGTLGYHILPETQEALLQAFEYFGMGVVILLPIWSKISERWKVKQDERNAQPHNAYREVINKPGALRND
jgi:hypothetical protein